MRVENNNFSLLNTAPFKKDREGQAETASFTEVLAGALREVNRLQLEAEGANWQLVRGEVENLHQVVLATEKAELALLLTLQVRNKVLEAYQELMRMQV